MPKSTREVIRDKQWRITTSELPETPGKPFLLFRSVYSIEYARTKRLSELVMNQHEREKY